MAEKKILIIEDNHLNLKLVRSLVQLGGHQPIESTDAENGIRIARERSPDLILMDIQLPGMDGLSATRKIKKDPDLEQIPVVALTSYAMSGDEQKALDAGCAGYITKPVDTRQFLKKVNAYLLETPQKTEAISKTEDPDKNDIRHKSLILIADDEPKNVKLLKAKLPPDRYAIITAYGGNECIEKAKESLPDLILLDIMMPDMDGYKVTRELKSNLNTRRIPIILVTALDGSEFRTTGIESGADEYLTKPVNTTELLTRIQSMLKVKQYREQLTIRTSSEESFRTQTGDTRLLTGDTKTPRVLIIEDDPKDLKLLTDYLESLPYDIVTASDGAEAIAYAQRTPVDLILLDVLLPGIDGFEVCRRLKEMDETKNIQIIIVTCLQSLESKIKGIEQGVDDFLVKPISPRELRARVMALLKKKTYLDKLHMHYEIALNSAITDGLTGLYNYAYFMKFLDLEVKRSARQTHSTALLMLDIDDFKKYNIALGHLAGDIILRDLAGLILKNIREIDLAARYGGEEFAMVLPYADRKGALSVAERILGQIRNHKLPGEFGSMPNHITASIGIAFCPLNDDSTAGLIQKADAMLYEAKENGKDRVCIYQATQDISPTKRHSPASRHE